MNENNDEIFSNNMLLSNDDLLSQELNSLVTDASIAESDEVAEVAKVKRRRENSARNSADNASAILAGLIEDTVEDARKEMEQRKSKAKDKEENKKASYDHIPKTEKELEEDRKLQLAKQKLEEETRKLEEAKGKRTQILAAIERQKKIEAGELDQEEEERKRKEKEDKERAEAEAKAKQEAEIQKANQRIEEQKAKIQELTPEPPESPKKKAAKRVALALVLLLIVVATFVSVYVVQGSKLAGDALYAYEHKSQEYESIAFTFQPTASNVTENPISHKLVVQEEPVDETRKGSRRPTGPVDKFGLGDVGGNILSGGGVIRF